MSKKEKNWWGVFLAFSIIGILSSLGDVYSLISAIGGSALTACVISFIVWLINRKKRPKFAHKYVRYKLLLQGLVLLK